MEQKRKIGNLLALAVMSYLSRHPMHPYELGRTLRDHGDARSIKFSHGSLYMVVQQLAKAGFITPLETSVRDAAEAALRDTADATELDVTELDVTELDVTELDVTELDVTELDVTELDATALDAADAGGPGGADAAAADGQRRGAAQGARSQRS